MCSVPRCVLEDKTKTLEVTKLSSGKKKSRLFCECVFFPFAVDFKCVGRTSRGHTGERSHIISYPPSFCGVSLYFSREKESAVPFPRRPGSRILYTNV